MDEIGYLPGVTDRKVSDPAVRLVGPITSRNCGLHGADPNSSDAGFLLKDLTLFGPALWSLPEAFRAARARAANP